MSGMHVERDLFLRGMRQHASGVTLVTTVHEGMRFGLTATSVCSVSAEPPQILACVNREAEAHAPLVRSRVFAVNMLSSEQRALAERFSGSLDVHGEERFANGQWVAGPAGTPVLASCVAYFECRVAQEMTAGTHTVFVGLVETVRVNPGLEPLIYVEGEYGLTAPFAGG